MHVFAFDFVLRNFYDNSATSARVYVCETDSPVTLSLNAGAMNATFRLTAESARDLAAALLTAADAKDEADQSRPNGCSTCEVSIDCFGD